MTSNLVSPLRCFTSDDDDRSGSLKLRDLSLATRSGVRGVHASQWLKSESLPHELQPNTIEALPDHRLLMALSTREFWLLDPDNLSQGTEPTFEPTKPGVWPLYNQNSHAWLVLSVEPRADMLAKLCGVDLRSKAFPLGTVAQTQMALVSTIIAHHLWRGEPVFSLFIDQSLTDFAWEALQDAMAEFNTTL